MGKGRGHTFERERLAAIVDSSQDAIISKTIDGVITSWNAAAERMFGYTAEEAVGQHITMLIPPDRQDEEIEILRQMRLGERIEHYETVRRHRDGACVELSLSISPLRDETGAIIGASKIARDIGAQKRAERLLRDREEELRRQDRRKDEFIAVLAHELRNPLAPLANCLALLDARGALPASTLREVTATAMRQVRHLTRLVDDLLDVSRVTRDAIELQKKVIPVAAVVEAAIETSQPLISEHGHTLSVELPAEPLSICADRTRITQVIANLLNNAAKYTPNGGRIVIAVRREGGNARISIHDNGVGIPPDMLGEIFEMFTQVDHSIERSHGGVGIGLPLARKLAELHGGTVDGYSKGLGHGSEFVLRLPLVVETAAPAPANRAPSAPALPRRRVLVADDNLDAVRTLALLLEALGQEVHIAHDGEEAAQQIAALKPDLALLDIGMPRLNGYEVARRVRAEMNGDGPVLVALTGWGQEQDRLTSAESGFDRHLVKPVTVQTLQELLH